MATKREITIKRFIDETAETILFTPYNKDGKLIVGEGLSCRVEMKKASKAMRHSAMMMGANHSIGDTAAKSQGTSLKEKFAAMNARAAHIMSGSDVWEGGRGPSESTLLFRALSEAYADWTTERVQEQIAAFKEKAKKLDVTWQTFQSKLFLSDKLSPIVTRLRAEEAKGLEIDTDELFAELDSAE